MRPLPALVAPFVRDVFRGVTLHADGGRLVVDPAALAGSGGRRRTKGAWRGMTQRILLADDSVTIRKVVELTFSDEDFTIDSVGDGAQAFEHARAQRPDIIISDVVMPGLNGYELCQQVKTDPSLQSVPFLFLKGTFESFDEEKARSCGADGFIVKPFESQEMIAKVRDLIGSGPLAPAPAAPVAPPRRRRRSAPAAAPACPSSPAGAAAPSSPVSPAARPPAVRRRTPAPPRPPRPAGAAPPAAATPAPAPRRCPPHRRARSGRRAPPSPRRPRRCRRAGRRRPPMPRRRPAVRTADAAAAARPRRRCRRRPRTVPLQPPPPAGSPATAATASVHRHRRRRRLPHQAPVDDFGFDFGESEGDRFGSPAVQPRLTRQPPPPGTFGRERRGPLERGEPARQRQRPSRDRARCRAGAGSRRGHRGAGGGDRAQPPPTCCSKTTPCSRRCPPPAGCARRRPPSTRRSAARGTAASPRPRRSPRAPRADRHRSGRDRAHRRRPGRGGGQEGSRAARRRTCAHDDRGGRLGGHPRPRRGDDPGRDRARQAVHPHRLSRPRRRTGGPWSPAGGGRRRRRGR